MRSRFSTSSATGCMDSPPACATRPSRARTWTATTSSSPHSCSRAGGRGVPALASGVPSPRLPAANVGRDYVAFPSQRLEGWLPTREVLNRFARHCATGAPMPEALVKKIEAASKFNKGFDNVEYLSSALVDMRLHLEPANARDIAAFEREALEAIGMPRQIVMRHRLPHFGHLFSGDSYSAGYYSYLWADTLSADAFEAFTEAGGAYDKKVASRLLENVFAAGNTVDPEQGYRAFRGRDAGIEALMRKRGFGQPSPRPLPREGEKSSRPLGGGSGRG